MNPTMLIQKLVKKNFKMKRILNMGREILVETPGCGTEISDTSPEVNQLLLLNRVVNHLISRYAEPDVQCLEMISYALIHPSSHRYIDI